MAMRSYEQLSSPLPSAPAAHAKSRGGRVFLAWWVIYLVVTPVYIFPSGLPQPADALMALMILVMATGFTMRIPIYHDLYLVGAAFLSWAAVVNWFWWAQYQESKFFLSSVYYAYNFAVMVVVFALFRKLGGGFVAATRTALLAAVALELLATFALPNVVRGVRTIGTFNNPNQLGYWTILVASTYLVTLGKDKLKYRDVAVLCVLAYISTLSLSKAAMGSFIVLLGSAMWLQGASIRAKFVLGSVLGIGAIVFVSMASNGLDQNGAFALALERFQNIGEQKDDSAAGRGYDRIWLYPQYLLAGAGEGAYDRFAGGNPGNEMHSTFGTVLFSYGVPGIVLFLIMLWVIFRRAPVRSLVYFAPVCLYGLTHQGLRASLLWVFLAMVFCLSRSELDAARSLRPGAQDLAGGAVNGGRARAELGSHRERAIRL
jgi:hypothetical protein